MTRHIGIDYGTKRVGLAISDGLGLIARPLEVVTRGSVVTRLGQLGVEHEIGVVVVGLPTGLSGGEGTSAAGARDLGEEIERHLGLTVEYVDERFTSRMADSVLIESGMRRRDRKETVDKVAAAIILQAFLDSKRDDAQGNSPTTADVEHPE